MNSSERQRKKYWYDKGLAGEECPPGSADRWPCEYDRVALEGWTKGVRMRHAIAIEEKRKNRLAPGSLLEIREGLREALNGQST